MARIGGRFKNFSKGVSRITGRISSRAAQIGKRRPGDQKRPKKGDAENDTKRSDTEIKEQLNKADMSTAADNKNIERAANSEKFNELEGKLTPQTTSSMRSMIDQSNQQSKKKNPSRSKTMGRALMGIGAAVSIGAAFQALNEYAKENSGCFKYEYSGSGEVKRDKVLCYSGTTTPGNQNDSFAEEQCYCSKINELGIEPSGGDRCGKVTDQTNNKFTVDNTKYLSTAACTPSNGIIGLVAKGKPWKFYKYEKMSIFGAMADIVENIVDEGTGFFGNIKKFAYYFIIGFVSLILLNFAWKFISPLISK